MTTAQAHRDEVLAIMRAATPGMLEAFYTALQQPGVALDDLRKALDLTLRTTGIEVKEKADNLPTVNITIVNNRATVESVAPPLEVLEDIKGQDLPTLNNEPPVTLSAQPAKPKSKAKLTPILDVDQDLSILSNLT